jgi:HEAT repeat protein
LKNGIIPDFMSVRETKPNAGRKLFFGLFIFPLLIAVGMAALLCSVVLITHETETPESLLAAIKSGSPSKRWQKAFELSNELNHANNIRREGLLREMIHILQDTSHYDSKTRGYMAMALSHFHNAEAVEALRTAVSRQEREVVLYALWALGNLGAKEAVPETLPLLKSEHEDLRKMAVYILGVIGNRSIAPKLYPLLEDSAADVRWNAALSLARLGDTAGADTLKQMLDRQALENTGNLSQNEIERVMVNAVKGLTLIEEANSIKILESLSRGDKSLKVRQAALEALVVKKQKGSALKT